VGDFLVRARAFWENLSGREQALVAATGGVAVILLLFAAVVNPVLSARANAESERESATQQYEATVRLARDYQEVAARLAVVERKIQATRGSTNLLTLLENLAQGAGVKIDKMQERSSPDNDRYRETRVEVSLTKVTLTQVTSFLHSIESSNQPMTVKNLRMRSRQDQSKLLDVDFSVSTFEAIQ